MPHEALILPIGHDLGARSAAPDVRLQQVRVGTEVMELTSSEYVVWLLAHSLDEDAPLTQRSLAEAGERFGIGRAETTATIERFVGDGLLAEVVPGGESALSFARRHRLTPLLFGLGPDPDNVGMLLIGLLGQPLAQVSTPLYDLWTWAHLSPELWQACEVAAEVARQQGVTDPEELDPELVLGGVLGSLHGLLRVRAAYLDRGTSG
ncbi:hypothetical protein ACFCV3_08170 [Kribbella sp. NPDC056345]|uniref:hypothetical protein n=1 Tax=Kribbella sp. NPDC056345 TaxID=3345789 RepID=UPI0035DFDF3D